MRLSRTFIWFLTLMGLFLLGYGLVFTRFDLVKVFNLMVTVLWPLAIFLGVGLVLLFWSIGQARRTDANQPRWWWIQTIASVIFLLMTVASLIVERKALIQRFSSDHIDNQRLAQLANAKLDGFAPADDDTRDWPQWRGPRRDGKSTETEINTDWHKNVPPIIWRRKIGGGYSSLAIVGNRLYTMDRKDEKERVICLDTQTGKDVWSHSYDVDFRSFDYNAGPRATPTIADGRLYAVGATGIFLCLELPGKATEQPRELWRHDMISEFNATLPRWGIACSPLIVGNQVIVQPGGSKGSVASFDRVTGKLLWSALSDANGYSSPINAELAAKQQIVAFTGEGVAGLETSTGKKLWYYDWPEQFQGNIATPIAAGNFVFISSAYDNGGCALLEISQQDGAFQANPVYVKRRKLMQNHHATCVLLDGHLYGFDKDFFKCVDMRTSLEKWASRKPGKGCLTYVDGHFIILTEKGELALVQANPKEFVLKGKMEIFDRAETWAVPVISRGFLFVRDKEEILCLDLRKPTAVSRH